MGAQGRLRLHESMQKRHRLHEEVQSRRLQAAAHRNSFEHMGDAEADAIESCRAPGVSSASGQRRTRLRAAGREQRQVWTAVRKRTGRQQQPPYLPITRMSRRMRVTMPPPGTCAVGPGV